MFMKFSVWLLLFISFNFKLVLCKDIEKDSSESRNKRDSSLEEIDVSETVIISSEDSPNSPNSGEEVDNTGYSDESDADESYEDETDDEISDKPSTSKREKKKRKRHKVDIDDENPHSKKIREKYLDVKFSRLDRWVTGFIELNLVNVIIWEFECTNMKSEKLLLSQFWQQQKDFVSYGSILKSLTRFWTHKLRSKNKKYNDPLIKNFILNNSSFKSKLVKNYTGKKKQFLHQMDDFILNLIELECSNIKKSLAIIILIFENNNDHLFVIFLLYLLLCSFKELNTLALYESFFKVINNENNLGNKIAAIGGEKIMKLIDELKLYLLDSASIKSSESEINIKYPLKMDHVDVKKFGYDFCLALLELVIIENSDLSLELITIFFGSRLSSSSEIFLAVDIFKTVKYYLINIIKIVAAILYDKGMLGTIKNRIRDFHGIDLSNIGTGFDTCIQHKSKYSELNQIMLLTDYQRKTKESQRRSRNYYLRKAKYVFMN